MFWKWTLMSQAYLKKTNSSESCLSNKLGSCHTSTQMGGIWGSHLASEAFIWKAFISLWWGDVSIQSANSWELKYEGKEKIVHTKSLVMVDWWPQGMDWNINHKMVNKKKKTINAQLEFHNGGMPGMFEKIHSYGTFIKIGIEFY